MFNVYFFYLSNFYIKTIFICNILVLINEKYFYTKPLL